MKQWKNNLIKKIVSDLFENEIEDFDIDRQKYLEDNEQDVPENIDLIPIYVDKDLIIKVTNIIMKDVEYMDEPEVLNHLSYSQGVKDAIFNNFINLIKKSAKQWKKNI